MSRPAVSTEQAARAERVRTVLRKALESSGIDLDDLTHRSGLRRRTVDKYLQTPSRAPSFFVIAGLAKALGIGLDDLVAQADDA